MKTAEEREKAFRIELAALLEAHKAELEITDLCGVETGIAIITMRGEWDNDGNETAEFTCFRI